MQTNQQKRIVYFTKHTTAGPSSRYRSYAYHTHLIENGFTITSYPLFPKSYLETFYRTGKKPFGTVILSYLKRFFQALFITKYNLIYIEYELFPYLPYALEKWLLRNKNHLVIDYDDAIFHNYDMSKNAIVKQLCGNKINKLVSNADAVITGSPYLTKVLSSYAKTVIEIPTSVLLEKYLATPVATITNSEKQKFRVGWIGSATTSKFVLLIKESFLQLQQQYEVQLVLIGFDKKLEPYLQGLHYEIHNWNENTEISLLKTCDLGIMPLSDEPFNHGKCGFKLIQYMACGLSTISTPMEANVKINGIGNNLFATTKEEWLHCFVTVIQKKNDCNIVGKKNIDIVRENYSIEKNKHIYLSLFESIMRNRL